MFLKLMPAFFSLLALSTISVGQTELQRSAARMNTDCSYWHARVDASIQVSQRVKKDLSKESTVLEAIACLLELKGNSKPTSYGAVINLRYLEAKLPNPTIEIAALSNISEIFTRNKLHANARVLLDKDGKRNSKATVEAAYRAYEDWFEKVKQIGLKEARLQKLDPLDGSGVRWY